jgi:hypothetical protein
MPLAHLFRFRLDYSRGFLSIPDYAWNMTSKNAHDAADLIFQKDKRGYEASKSDDGW